MNLKVVQHYHSTHQLGYSIFMTCERINHCCHSNEIMQHFHSEKTIQHSHSEEAIQRFHLEEAIQRFHSEEIIHHFHSKEILIQQIRTNKVMQLIQEDHAHVLGIIFNEICHH